MLKKIIASAALVAVVGLVAATAYVFGASAPTPEAPIVASAPSGPSEGVTVHGHWTIDVTEASGSLVSTSQFDNSFVGASRLAAILARSSGVGHWMLSAAAPGGSPPCEITGLANPCWITEIPPVQANYFDGLSVELIGATANQLRLSGTAVASRDGDITNVASFIQLCGPEVASQDVSSCTSGQSDVFSAKDLGSTDSVSVISGQSINLTVVFTFQ